MRVEFKITVETEDELKAVTAALGPLLDKAAEVSPEAARQALHALANDASLNADEEHFVRRLLDAGVTSRPQGWTAQRWGNTVSSVRRRIGAVAWHRDDDGNYHLIGEA